MQPTWGNNYERTDRELGLNGKLIDNYDLALDPAISAKIILRGMKKGRFTEKVLDDYVPNPASRANFSNASPILNGTDKADLIAGYPEKFQAGLQAGGWLYASARARCSTTRPCLTSDISSRRRNGSRLTVCRR